MTPRKKRAGKREEELAAISHELELSNEAISLAREHLEKAGVKPCAFFDDFAARAASEITGLRSESESLREQRDILFVTCAALVVLLFLGAVAWKVFDSPAASVKAGVSLEGQHGGTCLKVETNGVTTESLGGKTGVGEGKAQATHVNALPLGSAHCESHASLSGGSASTAQGPQAGSNPAPSTNLSSGVEGNVGHCLSPQGDRAQSSAAAPMDSRNQARPAQFISPFTPGPEPKGHPWPTQKADVFQELNDAGN